MPIGFHTGDKNQHSNEMDTDVIIHNLDTEFLQMMNDLSVDMEDLKKQEALEEQIQRLLLKLHKKAQAILDETRQRAALLARTTAIVPTDPVQAETLYKKLQEIDAELTPKIIALLNEINDHVIPDTSKVYKNYELSEKQIQHINEISRTMRTIVSNETNNIVHGQQYMQSLGMDIANQVAANKYSEKQN